MSRTISSFALATLLLAGCAAGPTETSDRNNRDEEAYTPIGSNIPRRDVKRGDVRAVDVPIGGTPVDPLRAGGTRVQ